MEHTEQRSDVTERVLAAFRADAHARERLPGGGVLNLDRKLPFLIVYRQPPVREDEGTRQLVIGEAAYMVADDGGDAELPALVRALAEAGTEELGSFLILELWAGDEGSDEFVVYAPTGSEPAGVEDLRRRLDALEPREFPTRAVLHRSEIRHPPDLPALITAQECWEIGCLLLGLEVPPIHRDPETGAVYPVFLRRLRSMLSPVLRHALYEFARVQTHAGIGSAQALGPRRFGDALARIDRELADIEASFPFLLLLSPRNADEAWERFRDDGFRKPPDLRYRLLPVDPDLLLRRLWSLDLDAIADPAMAFLLADKRDELNHQITLIAERNTPGFRYASIRLYGAVDDMLLNVAHEILETVEGESRAALGDGADGRVEWVDAAAFARRAEEEIEAYRRVLPSLAAVVQVRPDLTGLLVNRGDLYIGAELALHPRRVDALIHHEVGTHVVTWYNGGVQPLQQLRSGLAGYDELQEGLAVFSEYLAGALDARRMRVLAARVVAAHTIERGAEFMDTFRLLRRRWGFGAGSAFDIAGRVHESGGFTRDLIYLRGLLRLVEYVRAGGDLEPLFVGKIGVRHIEVMDELRARGYLRTPPLRPRFLDLPDAADRIEAVRRGLPLHGMIARL